MHCEPLLMWQARRRAGDGRQHAVRCTLEQLGEGCFELRVCMGDSVLVAETFATTEGLSRRADELRLALAPPTVVRH